MYVITFYSFKGGVGRTMALVNVAAELVRRGRTVLVVDFDLEAPGLETYDRLQPREEPRQRPGIVEYVTKFRDTLEVPDLLGYVYETKKPKPINNKGGKLWVMPAGRRDRAYRNALANLDWQRLYKDKHGFLLFEDTKKGWEAELKPDYVLIDSRTGDTDVLGICTRQLPDSVVLMFTPNEQNLAGLESVCRDIRREKTEGLKDIKLHFVAANVPDLDDERRILRRQMKAFKERLGFEEFSAIRRYESLNLLDQSVFVLDRRQSRLAKAYRRLLRMLRKDNPGDRTGAMLSLQDYAQRLLPRFDGSLEYVDSDDSLAYVDPVDDPLNKIANHFQDDVGIMSKIAECRILEWNYESAIRVLDWVLRLQPNLAGSLFLRARCKMNLGQSEKAAEDLLAYLRLPEQEEGGVMRCLCMLRGISQSRLLEAVELLAVHGFRGASRVEVAGLLTTFEEGVPLAAKTLRGLDETQRRAERGLPKALLQARCWRDVIELLEPRRAARPHPFELFDLALAYWGEQDEMPEPLCHEALHRNDEEGGPLEDHDPEIKSWLLWRVGNVPDAITSLDNTEERERRQRIDEPFFSQRRPFSIWRLRDVSIEQYLDDCRLVRRMFLGEPLRPEFLGPVAAHSKV